MGTSHYSDGFKRGAAHQITVRCYPVREVSRRLGVSTYSLFKWLKLFGEPSAGSADTKAGPSGSSIVTKHTGSKSGGGA